MPLGAGDTRVYTGPVRRVALLGATGSIGRQAIEVVDAHPELELCAVAAGTRRSEVERLADRVVMLEKGRIVADETPEELIKRFGRSNLEEVFLAIARRGAQEAP